MAHQQRRPRHFTRRSAQSFFKAVFESLEVRRLLHAGHDHSDQLAQTLTPDHAADHERAAIESRMYAAEYAAALARVMDNQAVSITAASDQGQWGPVFSTGSGLLSDITIHAHLLPETDAGGKGKILTWMSTARTFDTNNPWDPLESTCRHASLSIL